MSFSSARCALCIGHPGHELRVFGWMEAHRPVVDVITDGSGPDRAPRFESTRRLITEAGAACGWMAGAYSDRDFYRLILDGDTAPFLAMARRLAETWEAAGVEVVAGDMLEGFSPTHDICRMMINAAVDRMRARGRTVVNLEFPLESMRRPDMTEGSEVLRLDDAGFARKLAAAREAYPELTGEVDRLIGKYGEDAFRVEVLLPARSPAGLTWDEPEPPFYETYGHKQIAAGHYTELITWQDHMRPLAVALHGWGQRRED